MSSAGKYADFDEYIDYQIRKARAGIKWTELLTAGVGASVFVLGYLLMFTVLDHWVVPGGFSPTTRAVMLVTLIVVTAAWLVWKVFLPWMREVSGLYAAQAIEESDPQIKSAVLNYVDARSSGRDVPPHILRAMEKQAAVRLSKADVERAIDRSLLMRLAYALLGLVVVSCLYTVFSPKRISLARALTMASENVATQTEFLEIAPGDVEVLAGEIVDVTVDLRGDIPQSVVAYCTTADRSLVDEPVELRVVEDEPGRFRGQIAGANGRGILQPMTYRIVAGDAESRDFQITVLLAPSATVERVDFVFPEYMQFVPRTVPGGDVETWEGAEITFHAKVSMPVSTAILQFADSPGSKAEEIRMQIVNGTHLTGQWVATPRSDGSFPKHYRVFVKTEDGKQDPDPLLYNMAIKPDQPPDVELLDPVTDLEMPSNGIVPLIVRAHDPDFKLRSVSLRLSRDGAELPPDELIFDGLTNGFRRSFTGSWDLQLRPRRLQSGDVLTLFVEARDNKPPLGNKAVTPPLTIRIVDPVAEDKVRQKLDDMKQQQQQRADERRQQQEEQQQGASGSESGESGEQSSGGAGDSGESLETTSEPGDESSGSPGGSGEPSSDPTDQRSGEPQLADSNGGEGAGRSEKAADDEALQRFIDELNRKREAEDAGQPSGQPEAEDASDGTGSANGSENSTGDGTSGDAADGTDSSTSESASDADPARSKPKSGDTDPDGDDGKSAGAQERPADPQRGDRGQQAGSDDPGESGEPAESQSEEPSSLSGKNPLGETTDPDAATSKSSADNGEDQKDGDQKGGDQKGGDQKGGDQKGGDQKGGDQKGGDQKGGDQKGGDQKGGDQKGGDQKGGKSGKQSGGKGGKQAGNQPGKGGTKSGSNGGTGRSGTQAGEPGSGGGDPAGSQPDDPTVDDAKKAASLVLKRIEDELQRGEVDEKLLRELGWTEQDLAKFAERMRQRLNKLEDNAPNQSEQERRQFEEMLRSLNLKPRQNDRAGSKTRDRVTDGVNIRRSTPPADLREVYEAYKRSLSRTRRGSQ